MKWRCNTCHVEWVDWDCACWMCGWFGQPLNYTPNPFSTLIDPPAYTYKKPQGVAPLPGWAGGYASHG